MYKSLSNKEKKLLEQYYTRSGADSKRMILIRSIGAHPELTDRELAIKIYNTPKAGAKYTQLKSRVKRDILNLIQFTYSNDSYVNKSSHIRQTVRQFINDSELLMSRGLEELAISILDKALSFSLKYQCYLEALIVSDLLQQYKGLRSDTKRYDHYSSLKYKMLSVSEEKFKSYDLFIKITRHTFYKYEAYDIDQLSKDLSGIQKNSESHEVLGMNLRAQTFIAFNAGLYDKAFNSALDYYNLVKASHILNSRNNIAGANMQLSIIELERSNYDTCIEHSSSAISIFKKGSANEVRAIEIRYISYIRNGLFTKAHDDVKYALKSRALKTSIMMNATWKYRNALINYLKEGYEECLIILSTDIENKLRNTPWRNYFRILEIAALIKARKHDVADYRNEAFYKIILNSKEVDKRKFFIMYELYKRLVRLEWENDVFKTRESIEDARKEISALPRMGNNVEIIPLEQFIETLLKS